MEQMYYEFGIFSTFYGGKVMPDWIKSTISSQAPISFTIPSSPKKQLRGLNFCYVLRKEDCWYMNQSGSRRDLFFTLPVIGISNKTKNLTWVYEHCIKKVNVGGEWLTFISHWMFGMNEMEAGDKIIITVTDYWARCLVTNCGVNLVYDHGSMEEDALEYYKSWNHIIGGDLSSFQLTTGEYMLLHSRFTQYRQYDVYMTAVSMLNAQGGKVRSYLSNCCGIPSAAVAAANPLAYKFSWYPAGAIRAGQNENPIPFRAFSKRKSPTDNPLLPRVSFDPDMSPINVTLFSNSFQPWSCEIEGKVKIQPLKGVEEKVLCSLGWTNLSDFLDKSLVATYTDRGKEYQIQMYYEFGVFSTIYGGQAMPDWIRFKRSQTSISFTIPSSPNKQLKGLNFCYMQRRKWYGENSPTHPYFRLPAIEISNKTKNLTWVYKHCIEDINVEISNKIKTYLSHWMFGMNEMEAGDNIIIILEREDVEEGCAYECGVGFVYEDEEEDALEYYKSWNHIIGGDLSAFQSTTGEYILCHKEFTKKKTDPFRAFSKMKSPMSPSFHEKRRVSASSNKSDSSYELDLASFREKKRLR